MKDILNLIFAEFWLFLIFSYVNEQIIYWKEINKIDIKYARIKNNKKNILLYK